jgi:hypothetical protein
MPSVWPITLNPINSSMATIQQMLSEEVTMTSATRRSPANAIDRNSTWRRSDESGSGLDQGRSRLGIRTGVKLVNSMAARVGRSVMASVFRRLAANPCPKSMVQVVLATVGEPLGVSDARSSSEPQGRL